MPLDETVAIMRTMDAVLAEIVLVAELLLLDLAHRVAGQLVEEADLARALVRRELARDVVDQRPSRAAASSSATTQAMIFSPRSGSSSPVTAAS